MPAQLAPGQGLLQELQGKEEGEVTTPTASCPDALCTAALNMQRAHGHQLTAQHPCESADVQQNAAMLSVNMRAAHT